MAVGVAKKEGEEVNRLDFTIMSDDLKEMSDKLAGYAEEMRRRQQLSYMEQLYALIRGIEMINADFSYKAKTDR